MMKIPMIRIKRPSKRAFVILGVVLMIFLAFAIPVSVTYAKSMDDMIPSDGSTGTLYNKYSPSHYSFQTTMPDRHFWQVGAKATDGINSIYDHTLSMIFLGGVQITRFFNFIAREAFTFTFMDSLITGVEQIIQNVTGIKGGSIGNGMWGGMFGIVASITLAFVLWQVIRLKFLDSLQTMFSFILALVVALAFFSNAGTFLRFLNDSGNQLATSMYAGLATPGGLSTSSTTGVKAISEQVWMELVMKPYSMLQFDDASAYEEHPDIVDNVLKTTPYTDERDTALKAAAGTFPAVEKVRSDEQMIILLCNAIFSAIILGLFCFWAIATIFIRIKLLIHATVMSITLLASLLPGREAGLSVVRGQFLKLIGLVMMTVFTMFFLDLSLVIGHLTFNIVTQANGGWFTAMLLETIVVFVVFKYREEIGSVFSKAAGHIPMMPKAKSTVLDAVQRNVTRSLYNKAGTAIGEMFNRKEPEGVPSTFNPNSLSKAGNNLNDATTASMQLRYQREREAAEQYAAETGQPVQYTPYVQKVNENLRNGTKNPFRGMDKEWKEEKSRLGDIQKDGGDVKQAILTQGVSEGMNDQQVAATMYSNENSIRQASTFMVNRPKSAIGQMQRAGTLNKNRKLETSVNDFVMVELFDRYKMEYKWAVDTAAATGEPVQHSDFVKSMDDRFKAAGLNTTQKVNDTMLTRKGRIAVSSKFESMPEFGSKRDDLLRANEAFLRASTQEGVTATVAPVSIAAPISTASIQKITPPLPTATTKRDLPLTITGHPEIKSDIDMSKVKLPNNLKQSMNEAKAKLANSSSLDPGDRLEINTETNTQVFTTLKQRVSHEVSTDLEAMNNELQIMKKASSRKFTEADGNTETVNIINKTSQNAQQTRQSTIEPVGNKESATVGNNYSPIGQQTKQHRTVNEPESNKETVTVVKNSTPAGQSNRQNKTVTEETVTVFKNSTQNGQPNRQNKTVVEETVAVVKNSAQNGQP
ncbi:CD3337/EF1877 family mobilome membrane protein, partial [Paenibacillus ihuae]|uniref:CD3337/EF1877 family mobilome membrane protein n=1 Tax=Paenibacillus ihuae TaxID=1232431 RepID=UPI000ABDA794